jgi:hypothetical protein
MAPRPRRPRDPKEPLSAVIFTVAKYCDVTGLSEAEVARQMENGTLHTVRLGLRRLILSAKPSE